MACPQYRKQWIPVLCVMMGISFVGFYVTVPSTSFSVLLTPSQVSFPRPMAADPVPAHNQTVLVNPAASPFVSSNKSRVSTTTSSFTTTAATTPKFPPSKTSLAKLPTIKTTLTKLPTVTTTLTNLPTTKTTLAKPPTTKTTLAKPPTTKTTLAKPPTTKTTLAKLTGATATITPTEGVWCTNLTIAVQVTQPLQRTVHNNNSHQSPSPCINTLPCDWTPETFFKPTRIKTSLHCNASSTSIKYTRVNSNSTPALTTVQDKACLKRIIKDHCHGSNHKIPNVVHYVRFGAFNLTMDAFFSLVSVARFVRPCLVLYHGDSIPTGPYWKAVVQLVPNIVHVQVEKPQKIWDKVIRVVEHSSDVARIRIVSEFGGIYLDKDYLLLRPLDDLFNQSLVMGTETSSQICNGFFLGEPGAKFLDLWLANYTDFQDGQWAVHSTMRPFLLAKDFPNLIKVVATFFNPGWNVIQAYFKRKTTPAKYDWSKNYGLHFYTRLVKNYVYGSPRLDKQDHVVGDMVRHILYGGPSKCLHSS